MFKKILTRKGHKVRLDHLPSLRMLQTVMFDCFLFCRCISDNLSPKILHLPDEMNHFNFSYAD